MAAKDTVHIHLYIMIISFECLGFSVLHVTAFQLGTFTFRFAEVCPRSSRKIGFDPQPDGFLDDLVAPDAQPRVLRRRPCEMFWASPSQISTSAPGTDLRDSIWTVVDGKFEACNILHQDF